MGVIEVIGGIILLVAAVIVIVSAMLQEGKQGALNALAGSNESSYLGKNKNRSFQATLVRVTKYFGIVFMVVTLAVSAPRSSNRDEKRLPPQRKPFLSACLLWP